MKQNAWLQRLFRAIGWIVVGLWVGIAGNGQIYAQGDGLDGVESNKTEVVDMVTGVEAVENYTNR